MFLISGLSAFAQTEINLIYHKERDSSGCGGVPTYSALKAALDTAVQAETSGLNLQMWANDRKSRRNRLCRCILRQRPSGAVARQSRDIGTESQHGEFF
jgi:hypothetical protein